MKAFAKWIWGVSIAIDQLGNAIAGGNPDITISARVGYFAHKTPASAFYYYWKFLEAIIDFAFYPLQGPGHCVKALAKESAQGHVHGSDFMRALLGIIAVGGCMLISIFTWSAYALGQRPNITD